MLLTTWYQYDMQLAQGGVALQHSGAGLGDTNRLARENLLME